MIKNKLNDKHLDDFTASNAQLKMWKMHQGIRGKFLTEVDNVPVLTVHAWIKRIPDLIRGYELKNLCTMEELTCISKSLPDRVLAEKAQFIRNRKPFITTEAT